MKMYLAGLSTVKEIIGDIKPLYALQSFMDGKNACLFTLDRVGNENFLLDSGAYNFMNSYKGEITTEVITKYLDEYAEFISANNVKYFFNLDLETIIGVEESRKLRKILEDKTQRKCIPVFHKCMGLDEYKKLCEDYDYIALGTMRELKHHPKIIKELIRIARTYKCKVHGLGFTPQNVKEYGFYSVDSTTWLNGGKFGIVIKFNGEGLKKYAKRDCRAKNYKQINKHNLEEYIKYQKYLNNL